MKEFFATPLIFWFLFCTGIQAMIQVNFLIRFSKAQAKSHYYLSFVGLAYLTYILEMLVTVPQSFITQIGQLFIGVGIIYFFSGIILQQNSVISMVMAVLLITGNVLIESLITPIISIAAGIFAVSEMVSVIVTGALILIASYVLLYFFAIKYDIRSNSSAQYLWILVIPMFFIAMVMRILMATKYFPLGMDYNQLSRIVWQQNYEFLGLTILAFACVCGMLFAYEKLTLSLASAQQGKLLLNELNLQKKYVAEAKARYETTRIFRHDFKNHIIALGGMLEKNEIAKAKKYLERFVKISDDISFPISTGNVLIDIILSEKLAYAQAAGINVQYDIIIPPTVYIDDFDLSVIFSNGIDNAIRACSYVSNGEKTIDIVAKKNKNFFVLDMINSYENGNVPSGTGLGLSSIQMIVAKYQGTVNIFSEKEQFRLSVLLPL